MTEVIATGSSKVFTTRLSIMKINGRKKRWKWHFSVVRRTADYFAFDFSVPVEIILCPPLFLAGPASLFMSFLKYYKKQKITFSIESYFPLIQYWEELCCIVLIFIFATIFIKEIGIINFILQPPLYV